MCVCTLLACLFDVYLFEQLCLLECLCMHACVNTAMYGDTKHLIHPILDAFYVSMHISLAHILDVSV